MWSSLNRERETSVMTSQRGSHLHESVGQEKSTPGATVHASESPSVTSQNKRKSPDDTRLDCDDGGFHLSKRIKSTGTSNKFSFSSGSNTAPTSTPYLSLLPAELIDRICTHLPDYVEVTIFALTCRRHWQISRRHIKSRLELLSDWAGDRLICIGSYAEDLPPGLLTAAEEKELEMGLTHAEIVECWGIEDKESDDNDGKTKRVSLYDLAYARFPRRVDINLVKEVRKKLEHMNDHTLEVYKTCDLLLSLTKPYYSCERHHTQLPIGGPEVIGLRQVSWDGDLGGPEAEDEEQWAVLRNLSRREYVHGKAIQELKDRDYRHESEWVVRDLESFGFGEVLCLRSFWSQTDERSPYSWDYSRGVWTGHRFDIVLEQDLERAMEKEEWKDVSEEALAEVLKVCLTGYY